MFASPPVPHARQQLLDAYPLIRSRSATEARDLVGRALSPHHLQVRTQVRNFEARHNQIRLQHSAIHVLSYGAEVEIDPGERGDYYLLQLPLQGRARVCCNNEQAWVHPEAMGVLQPHARTRMVWSSDCAMIMLQVPSQTVRAAWQADDGPLPALRLTRSRQDSAVAAWWQALADMTRNLHHHGTQWLRHPAAFAAMEGFLISGLELLRPDGPDGPASMPAAAPMARVETSRLQRAVDHIHEHAHEGLTLAAIATAACMSPRALEAAFRRRYDNTPLAYARDVRLERVHEALQQAARTGQAASVTDIALQHGFIHMGRFAAYYKQRFGCSPSASLRGH